MGERVRLRGSPKTASSAWIDEAGNFVVETLDCHEMAESFFGGDVALTLTVDAADTPALAGQLGAVSGFPVDEELLRFAVERFGSYWSAKAWLEAAGIPFTTAFEDPA